MKFYSIFLIGFCVSMCSSCSIFKPDKTITKTTNKEVQERGSQGTNETSTQITTTTKFQRSAPIVSIPAATATTVDPTPPTFIVVPKTVTVDGQSITITPSISTSVTPTNFEQQPVSDYIDNTTDPNWDCEVKAVKVKASSSTFMNADYAAQAQFIYPGAVFDYSDLQNANYKEITENRNPIKLICDNPNMSGSTWNIINLPDQASLRDGIANLYSRFDNRQVGTQDLRYQTYETNTKAELSLMLSGGASYSGFSLENSYNNTTSSSQHNITIDAIKELYTIRVASPPNTTQYFNKSFGSGKNPVIVSSVTYGVRVLANFKLGTDTKDELEKFKLRYNGLTSSATVDFQYLSKNENSDQTINCYVVGGPGNSTVAFSKEQLEDGIKNLVAGSTYGNARPISYTLSDLNGNIIATTSLTDEIKTRKCVPHTEPPLLQDVIVKITTGSDDKDHDTHYRVFLRKGIDGNISDYGDCSLDDNRDFRFPDKINFVSEMNMQKVNRNICIKDFERANGGSILFHVYEGNDTWNISGISLIFIFKDGTVKTTEFQGFTISEHQSYFLFFDKDFNKI